MSDTLLLCATCGVEAADPLPSVCPICDDERQFVPRDGQAWTTAGELAASGRTIVVAEVEPGLRSLRVEPRTGIGQTCYLVTTEAGNLLFDVPPFIDQASIDAVAQLGGIRAIVASHPHMHGLQAAWSAACGGAHILIPRRDAHWVQRTSPHLELFDDVAEPVPGLHVRRVGGHFPGSCVVTYRAQDGALVLLGSDSISPVARTGWVTFMRSFPNYLPLSARAVRGIAERVADLPVERIYGSFGQRLLQDGARAIRDSAQRYAEWVAGEHDDLVGHD